MVKVIFRDNATGQIINKCVIDGSKMLTGDLVAQFATETGADTSSNFFVTSGEMLGRNISFLTLVDELPQEKEIVTISVLECLPANTPEPIRKLFEKVGEIQKGLLEDLMTTTIAGKTHEHIKSAFGKQKVLTLFHKRILDVCTSPQ